MSEKGDDESGNDPSAVEDQPSETDDGIEDSPVDPDLYLDTADRLERSIDTQVATIDGIDNKAEHVTRLVGIVISLVFSVIALVPNVDAISLQSTSLPVEVAFLLGILFLLTAMAGAIITYLSSKFRVGLHYNVGYYLSETEEPVDRHKHLRRVLGSYGRVLEENKKVIEINSKRFRRTLTALLLGVLFLATTGLLYLGQVDETQSWVGLGIALAIGAVAVWYILTGRYLTLEDIDAANG